MSPEVSPSPATLEECLAFVIDQAGLYTRAEWGRLLWVSNSAISQWVTGRTVPKPEMLALIWGVVSSHADRLPEDRRDCLARALDARSAGAANLAGIVLGYQVAQLGKRITRLSAAQALEVIDALERLLPAAAPAEGDVERQKARIREGGTMILAALAVPLSQFGDWGDIEEAIDFYALILAISEERSTRSRAVIRGEMVRLKVRPEWLTLNVLDAAMLALDRYFPLEIEGRR